MGMSRTEVAFIVALAIALAFSAAIVFSLSGALRRLLVDLCGTEDRAKFWTLFTNMMVFLVPVTAILLSFNNEHGGEALMLQVVSQLKWALMGLVGILLFLGAAVSTFIRPFRNAVHISPEQADDLQRLLARVEEIRARDILKRPTAS